MLENLKPISNQVLVEVKPYDTINIGGGKQIYLDTSFEQFQHSVTEGVVVAVPEKLKCGKSPGSLKYLTDMDLRVGDIVIFHYLCYANAKTGDNGIVNGKLFEDNGKTYLFVGYENIYLAKRVSKVPYLLARNMSEREIMVNQMIVDDEQKIVYNVVVCNGYVIFEGIGDVISSKYIIIPDNAKREVKQGVVKFVGSKIKKYFIPEAPGDNDDIQVGDVICLPKVGDVPLQYDLHRSFDGQKGYYRVQQNLVVAITGNALVDL